MLYQNVVFCFTYDVLVVLQSIFSCAERTSSLADGRQRLSSDDSAQPAFNGTIYCGVHLYFKQLVC